MSHEHANLSDYVPAHIIATLELPPVCSEFVAKVHRLLAEADLEDLAVRLGYQSRKKCRFQKTAALNVRSRLHYSSGGVGSIRQRRAAAGHQRTQGGLSATGRSMRHRWPSRRGSESARIDLRCPTSH